MSASPVPEYVDTRKVFLQQGEIHGTVGLDRLTRFRNCLASDEAHVEVALSFDIDESRRKLIRGKLKARVEVTCQRCLEPLAIELSDDINLAVLADETVTTNLDPSLDPWVCTEIKLDLASLVEEQLMLCMPIVSYHPNQDCLAKLNYKSLDQAQEESKTNPFAVLKALKE